MIFTRFPSKQPATSYEHSGTVTQSAFGKSGNGCQTIIRDFGQGEQRKSDFQLEFTFDDIVAMIKATAEGGNPRAKVLNAFLQSLDPLMAVVEEQNEEVVENYERHLAVTKRYRKKDHDED